MVGQDSRGASKGRLEWPSHRAHGAGVWALVEAAKTGLYRSDDWGETWELVSDQADLSQRPFYYMHVIAHPTDANSILS